MFSRVWLPLRGLRRSMAGATFSACRSCLAFCTSATVWVFSLGLLASPSIGTPVPPRRAVDEFRLKSTLPTLLNLQTRGGTNSRGLRPAYVEAGYVLFTGSRADDPGTGAHHVARAA